MRRFEGSRCFVPAPARPKNLIAVFLLSCCTTNLFCCTTGAADPYPYHSVPAFEWEAASPEDGQDGVPRNVICLLTFTSFPDVSSVSSSTVWLSGGSGAVPVLFRPNLPDCRLSVIPTSPLDGGRTYRLSVTTGLTSVFGESLAEPMALSFTTSDTLDATIPDERVSDELVVERLFEPHCGCCHSPDGGEFSHVLALEPALLSRAASRQVPDLDIVEPGRHHKSYLMHKVLSLPSIEGQPMPPTDRGASCGTPWPVDRSCGRAGELPRLLARWIDGLE